MISSVPVPKGNNGLLGMFMASVLLASALMGYVLAQDYFFEQPSGGTAPAIPNGLGTIGDGPAPEATMTNPPSYKYEITWELGNVYPQWGGTIGLTIRNSGSATLYFYQIGFYGEWIGGTGERDISTFVDPGRESRRIGMISFKGPRSENTTIYHNYQVGVGFMARDERAYNRTGVEDWYDAGVFHHGDRSFTVDPLTEKHPVFYSRTRNDLWNRVENLIDPSDSGVRSWANEIRESLGNKYTAYHVAAAFDVVRREIDYDIELPGNDVWKAPGDTLESCKGDCEDQSLLLASLIENLGGTTKINVIAGHAFATVYIGETQAEAQQVWDSIEEYYGTDLLPCWIVDDGYWLSIDTLGGLHAGGLPVNAAPTDSQFWEWDFTSTMVLSLIPVE